VATFSRTFSFLNCLLAGLEGSNQASKQGTNSLEESIVFEEGGFEGISTGNGQVRFACPFCEILILRLEGV
jgi:hypothetical protein